MKIRIFALILCILLFCAACGKAPSESASNTVTMPENSDSEPDVALSGSSGTPLIAEKNEAPSLPEKSVPDEESSQGTVSSIVEQSPEATDENPFKVEKLHDFDKAKMIGLEAYESELNSKVAILNQLLEKYDDGRRKSFFCTAVNLLDLQDINSVMVQIEDETKVDEPIKERSAIAVRLFQAMADERNVSLILRKKKKL